MFLYTSKSISANKCILRLFREYEGTVNHEEIMTKRDDELQLEGAKYFGSKFNTNNSFLYF